MLNQAEQFVEKKTSPEIDLKQEIFPGGPTFEVVDEWKARFGEIYSTTFDEDETFIWRTMNRVEYKEVLNIKGADLMYREERICTKCVLWPIGYDPIKIAAGKAGIPTLLTEQIMDKSGFSADNKEPERL